MKRLARMLFAGLGIVIAGSAISLVPHKPATAGGVTAVTVTNPSLAVTQSGPWNVGITGTPSVNIGTPTVNLGAGNTVGISGNVGIIGTPTVSVSTLPAVSLAGAPNVNIAGSSAILAVQDMAGPLTNVGRLPSQQVMLVFNLNCLPVSAWLAVTGSGGGSCFDMANEAGKVLVITDIFWSALGTAGTTCFATLGLNEPFLWSAAQVGPDGYVTKDEHHTTGAMMTVNPQLTSSCNLRNALLHGYLLPNQ